jgi:hypothetical protein
VDVSSYVGYLQIAIFVEFAFPVVQKSHFFIGRNTYFLAGHDNELRPYIANGIVFTRLVKRSSAEEMISWVRKYDRGITLVGVIYLAGVGIFLGRRCSCTLTIWLNPII